MNNDLECTVAEMFQAFSGKWILPVLYQIQSENGPKRFGALKRVVGNITNSELTKALRQLEAAGLIVRTEFDELPLRVEYEVSETGRSLTEPLIEVRKWLDNHHEVVRSLINKSV